METIKLKNKVYYVKVTNYEWRTAKKSICLRMVKDGVDVPLFFLSADKTAKVPNVRKLIRLYRKSLKDRSSVETYSLSYTYHYPNHEAEGLGVSNLQNRAIHYSKTFPSKAHILRFIKNTKHSASIPQWVTGVIRIENNNTSTEDKDCFVKGPIKVTFNSITSYYHDAPSLFAGNW